MYIHVVTISSKKIHVRIHIIIDVSTITLKFKFIFAANLLLFCQLKFHISLACQRIVVESFTFNSLQTLKCDLKVASLTT